MAEDVGHKRGRDVDGETQPQPKLHRAVPAISEVWKGFAAALRGQDKANFSAAIQWVTNVAQTGSEAERMELCTLLAPVAALMLQHREPRMLEEATRALRWLLIEPEDPSVPAPAGGAVHMLPSKARDLFLRTAGLIDAVINAFAFVVTPPIESRLETVKEVLSLIVCLCKVETLAKALWDRDMVPAIAKLCYASHRKVVIRACWALTKITKALQKVPVADMGKVSLPALFAAVQQNDEEIAFAAISALQSLFPPTADDAAVRPFEDQAVIERLITLARPPTNNSLRQRAVLLLASMASFTKQEDWYATLGCLSAFLEAVNEAPDASHKNCMCRAGLCGLAGLMKPDKNRLRPTLIRMTINFESLASCLTSSSPPCRRDARIMLQWLFRPFNSKTMLELVSTGLVPKIFDLQSTEAREWLVPNLRKTMDAVYPILDVPADQQLQYRALLTCLCYESLDKDRSSLEELLIRKKGLTILFKYVQKVVEDGTSPQDDFEAHAGVRFTFERLAEHPFMAIPVVDATAALPSEFHDLVNNPNMHDAELELDDGSIYFAHRVFLAKRSEYFDKMFRSKMVEAAQMRIKLGEIKGSVLLQMLRFLYTKTMTIASVDEALALVAAGCRFLVQGIEVPCLAYLRDRITAASVMEIMSFASHHSSRGLQDLCHAWVVRKYGELHMTEPFTVLFKDTDFLTELHQWLESGLKTFIANAPPVPLAAPAPR